jgi:AraC-like DNA-binding protein
MIYESPAIDRQAALKDVFHHMFLGTHGVRPKSDLRIAKLLEFIDKQEGSIGWDLQHVCRELRLDISGAYAARLFKRHTGVGVREYAKKKRMLIAAERLKITDLPIKVIAAELGYKALPDFTRMFKGHFHLKPTEFRAQSLREGKTDDLGTRGKRERRLARTKQAA